MPTRFLAPLVLVLLFHSACQQDPSSNDAQPLGTDNTALSKGERLARIRCASCHEYPEPDLLPRETWSKYVLPRMGYQMGIYPHDSIRQQLLEQGPVGKQVRAAGVFPAEAQISADDWQAIRSFYLRAAPEALTQPTLEPLQMGLPNFTIRRPSYRLSPPSTTLVQFGDKGHIFLGDANSRAMYQFSPTLDMQRAAGLREGAVHRIEGEDRSWVTVMGSFSPTDAQLGLLVELPNSSSERPKAIIQKLQRPVHTDRADLNGDGKADFVICEFAKWTGRLAWWSAQPDGSYQPHLLREQPGATQAYIRDLNGDQHMDIVALFGQGDEGIFAYYNDGQGNFREARLLSFPSSYGSSSFQLLDYNGDDAPDILYTCGDNADYPPVMKPYHGVRIFENRGNNSFEEALFLPLHGAYGAEAADFDQDGDLDIAAISFFPDYGQDSKRGFVYFQQQSNGSFRPFGFPQVDVGRWIVMDSGDPDGDGDLDLILGALTFEVVPPNELLETWVNQGTPFLLLENQLY